MKFDFGTYEEFIYKRTYARWLDDANRRETFTETVDRYKDFFIDRVPEDHQAEFTNAIKHIKSFDVMPSMRAFFTAGEALRRDNIAGYNCCAIAIDNIKSFSELLYILMCGTGVGYTVERQVINKLPTIPDTIDNIDKVIVFADSKKGWAEGFNTYIKHLFKGEVTSYDLSKLRPKGARLKTFGGKASGPEPLEMLLKHTENIIQNANGRRLTSIECHDLCCHIASAVVVGGVRRSACISLSNLSDERMRNAKSGEFWLADPQRFLSNNSVAYTEKPDIVTFMNEWQSLIKSKSGERGIFNREGCEFIVNKTGRRKNGYDWLCNPCCFTGDMKILTDKGYKKFEDIAGTKESPNEITLVNIDGYEMSKSDVWMVGDKPVCSVNFRNKESIKCTPDHIFMLNDGEECIAENLVGKRIMPYIEEYVVPQDEIKSFIAGFLLGDGQLTDRLDSAKRGTSMNLSKKDIDVAKFVGINYISGKNDYYERRFTEIADKFNLPMVKKPDIEGIPQSILVDETISTFLRGLYSANGSVINNGGRTLRVTYKTASKRLAESIVNILQENFSIYAYITTNKTKENMFSNGVYTCKESYDVNIAKWEHIKIFAEKIGFCQIYKMKTLVDGIIRKAPMVSSVKRFGVEKVYDFNEKATNWGVVEGCVVHNSEIILRPDSFCNLTEVVVRPWDTEKTLLKKVKNATILGCLQSTLTNFKFINKSFKKNCEDERLLGVSLTGLRDHHILNHVNDEAKALLSKMKITAVSTAKKWSKRLGINMPAAVTCIKPSGTTSQMVNSSSGLHPRMYDYYIRRVRVTSNDALCKFLIDKGVQHNPEVGDVVDNPNTYVFDFPIKSPDGAITSDSLKAIEQLKYWMMLQEHYCEHKPSCTIYVGNDEWLDVGAWVYKNWNYVSGISFLPKDDTLYQLPPYEEIDEDEFNKMIKNMPEIDWDEFNDYEVQDNTIGAQEYACSGGSCELI